ncbi:MAG: hypothetical protein QG632_133 [Candidatus Dependentiae bacterium]|nr:hypothetical protein [Candidatus Dependentiae bacterium]
MNLKNLMKTATLTIFFGGTSQIALAADCCAKPDSSSLIGEQLWCLAHSREAGQCLIVLGACMCKCNCNLMSPAQKESESDAESASSEEALAVDHRDIDTYIPKPGVFCTSLRRRKQLID